MSEEIESHILKRFEILQKLGKGAYGVVWKAIDKKTQRVIALKKVKYYFFLNYRFSMLFTIQPMLNVPTVK